MNELALFAGAGGGILGGKLLGWRTVCAVEWEAYPASVLCARQNDGLLPPFPIWDDVQTFDGHPWRGIVDVISGGFPCQDISAAGKGAGIDGERSGMWGEMARIICEVRPRFVFVENSPMLTSRGLGRVLGDLASMGFDARWGVLGAADVGANHQRDRIWIVAKWRGQLSHAQHNRIRWWEQQQESPKKTHGNMANARCELRSEGDTKELATNTPKRPTSPIHSQSSSKGQISNPNSIRLQRPTDQQELEGKGSNQLQVEQPRNQGEMAYSQRKRLERQPRNEFVQECGSSIDSSGGISAIGNNQWWAIEPNMGRVVDGVAARVDRLKAIGNGQVPLCAATAWRILSDKRRSQ